MKPLSIAIFPLLLLLLVSAGGEASSETTQSWIAALDSESASLEEKARACQRLGEAGEAAAIPALASLLFDPALNTYARAALERMPAGEADRVLQMALPSIEGLPLIGVIQSLGARGDSAAVTPLVNLLESADTQDDASVRVAEAVLHALGLLGTPEAVLVILDHLEGSRPEIRAAAASACLLSAEAHRKAGQPALAALLHEAILKKGPPTHRAPAARQRLLAADSPEPFVQGLHADEAEIRKVTLLTVRDRPSPALADALHDELQRTDAPHLKSLLVQALADCSNERTVSVLTESFPAAGADVRKVIIDALARLGGAEAAGVLLGLALEHTSARDALVTMAGSEVDRALTEALETASDDSSRLTWIGIAGQRQSPALLPALLAQCEAPEPETRAAALRAVRPLVTSEHVPILVRQYRNAEDEVQRAAFRALADAARRGDPEDRLRAGEQLLTEWQGTGPGRQKEVWARILVELGHPPALPLLAGDLKADSPEKATAAIRLLGQWPDWTPVVSIIPLCGDPELRDVALRAALRLLNASDNAQARVHWLAELAPFIETTAEKRAYLGALSGTSSPGARALAEPYQKDPDVEAEAAAALQALEALGF